MQNPDVFDLGSSTRHAGGRDKTGNHILQWNSELAFSVRMMPPNAKRKPD
jgi:hypothetical protein